MDFGAIVNKTLQQKNLKIADLARMSGISYPYCADLVNGRRRWNEDTITKVCTALGLKIDIYPIDKTGTEGSR